jgi:hypothetical protein
MRKDGSNSPWKATLRERLDFYSIPEPNSGCLLWTATGRQSGYGWLSWRGQRGPAHKMAWIDKHGPIPAGKILLHSCDVPACINLDHLRLGTHAENAADKVKRGRAARQPGESNHRAKLTEANAILIKSSVEPAASLARRLGVTPGTIYNIRKGRSWSHLGGGK